MNKRASYEIPFQLCSSIINYRQLLASKLYLMYKSFLRSLLQGSQNNSELRYENLVTFKIGPIQAKPFFLISKDDLEEIKHIAIKASSAA